MSDSPTPPASRASRRGFLTGAGAALTGVLAPPLTAAGAARAGVDPAPEGLFLNVLDYGAKGDGETMNTEAIKRAIESATQRGGGTLYFPPGTYLTGPIHLKSNLTLHVDTGATLRFSQDFGDYYPMVKTRWQGVECQNFSPLIYGYEVENVAIRGGGTLDGQGQPWWDYVQNLRDEVKRTDQVPDSVWQRRFRAANPADKMQSYGFCRPQLFHTYRCKNVRVEGVSFVNSPFWTVHFVLTENVCVEGVRITSEPAPNTDGVNAESSKNVRISNCYFKTSDDCVAIKAGKGAEARREGNACENISVTNCTMLGGAAGVAIGSEMSGGVRNVAVSNCVFNGTAKGIHVKTMRGRGGVVENVRVSNIVMQNIEASWGEPTGIYLNMLYYTTDFTPRPVTERTPVLRDLHFSNITGNDMPIAIRLHGLPESPIRDVTVRDVQFDAEKGGDCQYARGVAFRDVVINAESGPALACESVQDLEIEGVKTRRPHPETPVVRLNDAQNAFVHGCFPAPGTDSFVRLAGAATKDVVVKANNMRHAKTPVQVEKDVNRAELIHE